MTTHNYNIVKAFPARVVKCKNDKLIDMEEGAQLSYDDESLPQNYN